MMLTQKTLVPVSLSEKSRYKVNYIKQLLSSVKLK